MQGFGEDYTGTAATRTEGVLSISGPLILPSFPVFPASGLGVLKKIVSQPHDAVYEINWKMKVPVSV
jgi:hypothetical protein